MKAQIQQAGLISGIGILMMVLTVPIAEFVIFPELIDYKDAEVTFHTINENRRLFTIGIFLHVITLICDLVVAWSLLDQRIGIFRYSLLCSVLHLQLSPWPPF